ncbi:carboxypeptidase regulatory-like domain-containing protein [Paenibacillus sp. YYML68]|uniref:carboxypeptidase regulatory-like domain-containing protein n=1 Tax=Paenibacillus sp. YYML68 TaxID=2909250 RepID=UPI0024923595|nr:carboxypeptidase regulatory-like domain-containing protein [Paenibacillus sp. YYML68]
MRLFISACLLSSSVLPAAATTASGMGLDELVKVMNDSELRKQLDANNDGVLDKSEVHSLLDHVQPAVETTAVVQRSYSIHGQVLDDQSQPVAGALVRIEGYSSPVETNAQGSFTIANIPVSQVAKLVVNKSGYEPASTSLFNVLAKPAVQTGSLLLKRIPQFGSVTGVVYGPSDEPLAMTTVSHKGGSLQTVTDGAGRFMLSGMPEGQQTITIHHAVYGNVERFVQVTGNQTSDLGTIRYTANPPQLGSITGAVTTESGIALPGAVVSIPGTVHSTVAQGAAATFMLSGLPLGTVDLEVKANGYKTRLISGITVTSATYHLGAVALSAVPQYGTVRTYVQALNGLEIAGAEVTLKSEDGTVTRALVTNAEGFVDFTDVPAQKTYTLTAQKNGYYAPLGTSHSFYLEPGNHALKQIYLEAGAVVATASELHAALADPSVPSIMVKTDIELTEPLLFTRSITLRATYGESHSIRAPYFAIDYRQGEPSPLLGTYDNLKLVSVVGTDEEKLRKALAGPSSRIETTGLGGYSGTLVPNVTIYGHRYFTTSGNESLIAFPTYPEAFFAALQDERVSKVYLSSDMYINSGTVQFPSRPLQLISDSPKELYASSFEQTGQVTLLNVKLHDSQPPTQVNLTATTVEAGETGELSVKMDKPGYVYLVHADYTPQTKEEITELLIELPGKVAYALVMDAAYTPIDTSQLQVGTFNVYTEGVHGISAPLATVTVVDTKKPSVLLITDDSVEAGQDVQVRSNEESSLYLVRADMTETELSEALDRGDPLNWAYTYAGEDAWITTYGLVPGSYVVYAVDVSGNISNPTGVVQVRSGDGRLYGYAYDVNGETITNALLTVEYADGQTAEAYTDDEGLFDLTGLRTEVAFDVTLLKEGFMEAKLHNMKLSSGQSLLVSMETVSTEPVMTVGDLSYAIDTDAIAIPVNVPSYEGTIQRGAAPLYMFRGGSDSTQTAFVVNIEQLQAALLDPDVSDIFVVESIDAPYDTVTFPDRAIKLYSDELMYIEVQDFANTPNGTLYNVNLYPDKIAPTLEVTETIAVIGQTVLKVKSSEAGYVYLVHEDISYTDGDSLWEALLDYTSNYGKITYTYVTPDGLQAPTYSGLLYTDYLVPGSYRVVAADNAGLVSEPKPIMVVEDTYAPIFLSLSPGSIYPGDALTVTLSESADLYLVPKGMQWTREEIVQNGQYVQYVTGNTVTELNTEYFPAGSYELYAIDSENNVSAPSPAFSVQYSPSQALDLIRNHEAYQVTAEWLQAAGISNVHSAELDVYQYAIANGAEELAAANDSAAVVLLQDWIDRANSGTIIQRALITEVWSDVSAGTFSAYMLTGVTDSNFKVVKKQLIREFTSFANDGNLFTLAQLQAIIQKAAPYYSAQMSYSHLAGVTPGSPGSKQVQLSIKVANADGLALDGFTEEAFSVTIDGTPVTFATDSRFTDFNAIGGGLYEVTFVGEEDFQLYSLLDLKVHNVPIQSSELHVRMPDSPLVATINMELGMGGFTEVIPLTFTNAGIVGVTEGNLQHVEQQLLYAYVTAGGDLSGEEMQQVVNGVLLIESIQYEDTSVTVTFRASLTDGHDVVRNDAYRLSSDGVEVFGASEVTTLPGRAVRMNLSGALDADHPITLRYKDEPGNTDPLYVNGERIGTYMYTILHNPLRHITLAAQQWNESSGEWPIYVNEWLFQELGIMGYEDSSNAMKNALLYQAMINMEAHSLTAQQVQAALQGMVEVEQAFTYEGSDEITVYMNQSLYMNSVDLSRFRVYQPFSMVPLTVVYAEVNTSQMLLIRVQEPLNQHGGPVFIEYDGESETGDRLTAESEEFIPSWGAVRVQLIPPL